MEEIKKLYEKLHTSSEKEREQFWNLIIEKNKIIFNKRREELDKLNETLIQKIDDIFPR